MQDTEPIHRRTEAVYRHLQEHFNPNFKHLILAARNYQKALNAVSSPARAFNDALSKCAKVAISQVGGTGNIGASLLQVTEVFKEIQRQHEENVRAFQADILLPFENKQENEHRLLQTDYKTYTAGHKSAIQPYEHAQAKFRKVQKKSKSKGYTDPREPQYARAAQETKAKLDEYRIKGLQKALLHERKRHCFMLDKLCSLINKHVTHHSKAHELYVHQLQEWEMACSEPTTLPAALENQIRTGMQDLDYEDTLRRRGTVMSEGRPRSLDFDHINGYDDSDYRLPNGRPASTAGTDYTNVNTQQSMGFHSLNRQIALPPAPGSGQLRAEHSHTAETDDQLSFSEGDIINSIGTPQQGWQYGENTRTNMRGWFPLSFTKPTDENRYTMGPRVKSTGDLLAAMENQDFNGQDLRSMTMPKPYENNLLQRLQNTNMMNPTTRTVIPPPPSQPPTAVWARQNPVYTGTFKRQNVPIMGAGQYPAQRPNIIYEDSYYAYQTQAQASSNPEIGRSMGHYDGRPLPGPPPPPSTLPPSGHARDMSPMRQVERSPSPGMRTRNSRSQNMPKGAPPPPPPPPPPPINDTPSSNTESNRDKTKNEPPQNYYSASPNLHRNSGYDQYSASPYQTPHQVHSSYSANGYSSSQLPGSRHTMPPRASQSYSNYHRFEEPPRGMPPPPTPPPMDYMSDDSSTANNTSNPFANVKLKKTVTNDRSAPLIK